MPFPRRILLTPVLASCALIGASALAAAAVLPRAAPLFRAVAPASQQYASPDAVITTSAQVPGMAWPDTTPKVVGTYVTTVLYISWTPCFDCVNGKTKGTFGEGYPLGYVNTNTSALGVLFEWFDVSYTGSCTVTVTLTMAGKTLKTASGSVNPSPGGVENSLMSVTRGSTWHGTATMTAKSVCAGTTASAKGVVHFQ
jgi:hypothetical protein